MLSAFKAEAKPADWWRALMADITAKSGLRVTFIPTVLNADTMTSFAPISYGIGNWGMRNPGNILAGPNYAARAHALGLKWMAPIAVQDERPNQKMYDEAGNTETLRASWQRAIGDQADLAQLMTWNDYSEGTSFAPSAGHGYSFLDINAYWQTQFQTGRAPAIVRDAMYVTHRIQKYAATPSYPQQLMVHARLQGGPGRPGHRRGAHLPDRAGRHHRPGRRQHGTPTPRRPASTRSSTRWTPGTSRSTAQRYGTTVGVADSPYTVDATPYTQDLAYYAVTGRMVNADSRATAAWRPPAPTPAPLPSSGATDNGVWCRSTDPGAGFSASAARFSTGRRRSPGTATGWICSWSAPTAACSTERDRRRVRGARGKPLAAR